MLRERRSFAGLEPLATAGARPSERTVEPLLGACIHATFEWSRQAADGSTITRRAPTSSGDRSARAGSARRGEGRRRRTRPTSRRDEQRRRRPLLKTPPARHGPPRLLSAMSAGRAAVLAAASVGLVEPFVRRGGSPAHG